MKFNFIQKKSGYIPKSHIKRLNSYTFRKVPQNICDSNAFLKCLKNLHLPSLFVNKYYQNKEEYLFSAKDVFEKKINDNCSFEYFFF